MIGERVGLSHGRSNLALATIVAAAALLVVLAAHVVPTGYRSVRAVQYHPHSAAIPTAQASAAAQQQSPDAPARGWSWLPTLASIVLAVAIVGAVVAIARTSTVSARRARAGRDAGGAAVEQRRLDEVARQVTEAAAAGVDALQTGAVEDAIVACWLRLQDAAAASGVQPDEADTPTEFVTRVLERSMVPREPLATLAGLYREARFSAHRMTETDRLRARAALEAIGAGLAATARG